MRQPNGCSTHAPKSSAAKQCIKVLAQTKKEENLWHCLPAGNDSDIKMWTLVRYCYNRSRAAPQPSSVQALYKLIGELQSSHSRDCKPVVLDLFAMDHFSMPTVTPHEQLVETVLHIGQWTFYQGFMKLSVDHWKFQVDHRWCYCMYVNLSISVIDSSIVKVLGFCSPVKKQRVVLLAFHDKDPPCFRIKQFHFYLPWMLSVAF